MLGQKESKSKIAPSEADCRTKNKFKFWILPVGIVDLNAVGMKGCRENS